MLICPTGHGPKEGRYCTECGAELVAALPGGDTLRNRSPEAHATVTQTFILPGATGGGGLSALVKCPKCGHRKSESDVFDCRGPCGRVNLCLRHFDEEHDCCCDCAAALRGTAAQEAARVAALEAEVRVQAEALEKARVEAEVRVAALEKAEAQVPNIAKEVQPHLEEVEDQPRQAQGSPSGVAGGAAVAEVGKWDPELSAEEAVEPEDMSLTSARRQHIGMELVRISAVEFLFDGDEAVDPEPNDDDYELEQHNPRQNEYWMGVTPVTNAQYKAFVDATGHQPPQHWQNGRPPEGKDRHPVVFVSWNDAQAFCRWVGLRLPSRYEWHWAAQGGEGRTYPWGDAWERERCNSREARIDDTTEVGRYSPGGDSPQGCVDMAGNVKEWCDDGYPAEGGRVARYWVGGSFNNEMDPSYGWGHDGWALNGSSNEDASGSDLGFRCAWSNETGAQRIERAKAEAELAEWRLHGAQIEADEAEIARQEVAAETERLTELRRRAVEIANKQPLWRWIGIELVHIPAGDFLYGDEQRKVTLPAFFLAKTAVTNAQYKVFVEVMGHRPPSSWQYGCIPEGKEQHPVEGVSWEDAKAFCQWVGLRLPSEQEWEKGARGPDGREYPWGAWREGCCNSQEARVRDTTPVDRYPSGASPYGVLDMVGNVWEWCDDWYDSKQEYRVLRGGGRLSARYVRAAYRNRSRPSTGDYGFRCACSG